MAAAWTIKTGRKRSQMTTVVALLAFASLPFFAIQKSISLPIQNSAIPELGKSGTSSWSLSHDSLRTHRIRFDKNIESIYIPSTIEKYIVDHSVELGYDTSGDEFSEGCLIWNDQSATTPEIYKGLQSYARDLEVYNTLIRQAEPIPNLLDSIKKNGNHKICASARPHPNGIEALFSSKQLSLSKSGYVEPITPPMRHHSICKDLSNNGARMDYLVHDFEAMCHSLKPTSKIILIDMGASLKFGGKDQPLIHLLDQYEKFGFTFDHIYGFEITEIDPEDAYDLIPEKYLAAYHWINVGVSKEEGSKLNPLHSILKKFDEDDFIVVKLDIDYSEIENPLAEQLLEDKDGVYHKLVDQFYFEHHVNLEEMWTLWDTGDGDPSVKASLDLFHGLRQKGIPSHFWP